MKRSILIGLILSTTLAFVGCSSNNNEGSNSQTSSENKVEEKVDKKKINDEIIAKFEELLPEVLNVYEENNIIVEDSFNREDKIYNKTSYIDTPWREAKEHTDVSSSSFRIGFDEEGLAKDIAWSTYITMDEDVMKSEEFKIEDTFLGSISKLMITDPEHNAKVNESVNNHYKNHGNARYEFEYGNVDGTAVIEGSELRYTIHIYPESR